VTCLCRYLENEPLTPGVGARDIANWVCKDDYNKTQDRYSDTYTEGTLKQVDQSPVLAGWIHGSEPTNRVVWASGHRKRLSSCFNQAWLTKFCSWSWQIYSYVLWLILSYRFVYLQFVRSHIIDKLREKSDGQSSLMHAVSFVYCSWDKPKTAVDIAAAILRQLILARRISPDTRTLIQQFNETGRQLSLSKILDILCRDSKKLERHYIFVDGFDEIPDEAERDKLAKALFELTAKSLPVRVFVTSRPLPVIRPLFENASEYKLSASPEDIKMHISRFVSERKSLQQLVQGLNEGELETAIIGSANHM
jgi:hypothetical protein